MSKTMLGLEENIESALCYLLGPVTGIFFLVFERENKKIRFHAMQSTVYFGILMLLEFVVRMFIRIPLIGIAAGIINWALGIVVLVSAIYLIYNAYKGKMFKVPYIGDVAWQKVNK